MKKLYVFALLLFASISSSHAQDCGISNLEVIFDYSPYIWYPCYQGDIGFYIGFDGSELEGDFTITIDGELLGVYTYDQYTASGGQFPDYRVDIPYEIGVLGDGLEHEAVLTDVEDPNCSFTLTFTAPDCDEECPLNVQSIYPHVNLDVFSLTDSTYRLYMEPFFANDVDGSAILEIIENATFEDIYSIEVQLSDFPLLIDDLPLTSNIHLWNLTMTEDESCATGGEYYPEEWSLSLNDCDFNQFYGSYTNCMDGEFFIDFVFNHGNTSDTFSVSGNGEDFGSFSYGDLSYMVGPFTSGITSVDLTIIDEDDSSCSASTQITVPMSYCPEPECAVESLEILNLSCQTDSTYSLSFSTELINPENELIDVWVNEQFQGSFNISAESFTIEDIVLSDDQMGMLKVCVNDNLDCCTEIEFEEPNCEMFSEDCSLFNLSTEAHECEDGEFYVDFGFEAQSQSDSFYVSGNGMDYGVFAYGQDFYTVGPFSADGISVYELIITDSVNDVCSTSIEFGAAECPVGDCWIEGIEVINMECESDSTYVLTFDAEIIDSGNDFIDIWINGVFNGSFFIESLPISILGVEANESNYDTIEICVGDNDSCCSTLQYMVPDCIDNGLCSIENLEVYNVECDSDSTYSMTFNADIINGLTDFIEVTAFLDYQGEFNVNDLPITLAGIVPVEGAEDILLVCAGGLDACCNAVNYDEPDCISNHIQEILNQFLVYPNPVTETLIIQYGELSENIDVVIYDSSGRVVFSQIGISDKIYVSELASGIYQLVIYQGNEKVFTTQMMKK